MKGKSKEKKNDFYERMFDSEKFILLGKLASGVAHEINNPIMIIQNYISLILDDIHDEGEVKLSINTESYEFLQEILSECQRISKITKNLLEFSRSSSKKPHVHNVESILINTLKLLDPMIVKSQIHIKVDIQADQTKCIVKSNEIQQVFMNIIDNSIYSLRQKYRNLKNSPDKKLINILLKNEAIPDKDKNMINYVVLDFYDDGIGISKKIEKHIFDPFFTTKKTKEIVPEHEKYQGLGLGLPYCQTILEDYQGFITFESKENEDALFHVYLPVHHSEEIDEDSECDDEVNF